MALPVTGLAIEGLNGAITIAITDTITATVTIAEFKAGSAAAVYSNPALVITPRPPLCAS